MLRRLRVFGVATLAAVLCAAAEAAIPDKEPRVTREGSYEKLFADDFSAGEGEIQHYLLTDEGDRLRLRFESQDPPGWQTGDAVRVTGSSDGETLDVERSERVAGRHAQDASAASSWTTGPKRVLLIRFNFADDTSQPYSDTTSQNVMFGAAGSVAAFYAEGSYGLTTHTGSITPWLTVPSNKPTTCNPFTASSQASTLAKAAGYDPAAYQFQVYVFPHLPCGWAGLASVGGPGAWINQSLSTYVVAHELGHNYGLEHAHSLACGGATFGSACSRSEYGDPFDTMGNGLHQFNAYAKYSLNWLLPADIAIISSGTSTFGLSALESPSGTRAVQIVSGTGHTYWLEFRQAIGFDANLAGNANVMNGALLHIGPSDVGGADLLDATPGTATFGDAALDVGNAVTDVKANLRLTTVSKAGGVLTVSVQFGIVPPVATFTFSPASPLAGHAVSFTDTSGGLPSSWQWDFGDGAKSTLQNPTHAYSAAGAHTVTLVASNAQGASAPATQSVPVAVLTGTSFYTIAPCRLFDTRKAFGLYGGPALFASLTRSFTISGRCGIPAGAIAVSGNLAVTGAFQPGVLTLFPAGTPIPRTASINFRAAQSRSNNVVFELGTGGAVNVHTNMPSGSVQAILDVTGYFK